MRARVRSLHGHLKCNDEGVPKGSPIFKNDVASSQNQCRIAGARYASLSELCGILANFGQF